MPGKQSCQYLPNSNLTDTLTGPAHQVTNTWEAHRNVLKSKAHLSTDGANAALSSITYGPLTTGSDAVNGIGQRLAAHRTLAGSSIGTEAWAFNENGEVVSSDHSDQFKDRSYLYDGIGNRLTSSAGDPPASTRSYAPNALNQYQSITTAGTTTTRLHDSDGNLMDDGQERYTWDAENRLVALLRKSDNAVIAEYRYDHMSRRVLKSTTPLAPQGQEERAFVYDGWNPITEYQGQSRTTLTHQRSYTWGPDLSGSLQGAGGVGGLRVIEEKQGTHTGTYYPLYDGNGNVTELVKSTTGTTTLVAHYEYDPFGNLTETQDSDGSGYASVNDYKFSTKYQDEESNLYYYGYRYYNPVAGRWPNRDRIEESGGINLYSMIENDTLNQVDILGLQGGRRGGGPGRVRFRSAVAQLEKIPTIMRSEGFLVGAKAMEKWFSRSPEDTSPVDGLLTMQWALSFERVQTAHQNLIQELYKTDNAKASLRNTLSDSGLLRTGVQFDHTSGKASAMHKFHYQHSKIGHAYASVDDFTMAVGRAALYVTAAGCVDDNEIIVEKIGVYLKDDYRFNEGENQSLGVWDFKEMAFEGFFELYPLPGEYRISNRHFTSFQSRFRRGGDYESYSEIQAFPLQDKLRIKR